MLVQRSLTDLAVRFAGGTQLVIGAVFQRQQRVIGAWQYLQDLIELTLG